MPDQDPPPSSPFPPSMGPGARPSQHGSSPGFATLEEIKAFRKSYDVHVDSNRLNLSYELDGQRRSYSIPFENMPIGGFVQSLYFGAESTLAGTLIIDAIRGAENLTGQQLSQTEAEGFAKHSIKKLQYGTAGTAVALFSAYGLAYQGRKEMKFPFMKPKPLERYNNFPNRYIPVLRGSLAQLMWQLTRANVYAAIGLMAAGPVFASMGDVSMIAGLYQDRRTQNVLKKMRAKGGFNRIDSNRTRPGQPKAQPQVQQQGDDTNPQDDYQSSTYGGVDAYSGEATFTDGSADTGLVSDSMETQRQRQPPQPSLPQRRQPEPQSQSSSSSDFFFDDASPTAGNDPDMATPTPYNRPSGESVWARIRKGNPHTETQDYSRLDSVVPDGRGSTMNTDQRSRGIEKRFERAGEDAAARGRESSGDSFSFEKGEEERALAKEVAQREFDAMLERERKESGGGSDGGGRQGVSDESGGGQGMSAWERRRRGG